MGFEPTTASLEGWNSTTELRPPTRNQLPSPYHCVARPRAAAIVLARFMIGEAPIQTIDFVTQPL